MKTVSCHHPSLCQYRKILVTHCIALCTVYYVLVCDCEMLNNSEISKRSRSRESTDTEPSPSSVQLSKKMATHSSVVPPAPVTNSMQSPPQYQVPYPHMGYHGPGPYISPSQGACAGQPPQAFISDVDIQRIAEAVRGIIVNDVQTIVKPLQEQITTLQRENIKLRREIDDLEMYSRRDCIRVAGVSEDRADTDDAIMDIANKLQIPIKREDISVSHRVGPKNSD